MQIQTFTVVVGGPACNAKCPYCVSKLTGCTNGIDVGQKAMQINKRNFNIACNFAKMSGVSTVLLTGKGEPTLYPDHITRYLEQVEKWQFPFIELQTNGILLNQLQDELKEWYDAGLTTVSLSCASKYQKNNLAIFGKDIRLEENIKLLHRIGFSVRISCVMTDDYISSITNITNFADWCKYNEVEQFTVRPATNIPLDETEEDNTKKEVHQWIEENSHTVWSNMIDICKWFDDPANATTLLTLAHGAKVYDYNGQNISLNSCLTRSDNPDDIRQLIFSSDGHLRYDWVKEGAIIL
jgi:molybdenum cofactor biosynthesis enzyme MoaA